MPLQRSEYSCPTCRRSGTKSQIVANLGVLECDRVPEHRWVDMMDFFNENPVMEYKVEVAKNLPQQGHEPMQLSVPIGLKTALETKYGDKAAATAASILQQMVEGEIMIIGQTDLERLSSAEGLGRKPVSSGEMFGMIYSLRQELADQKSITEAATKDLKAYENVSPGRVVVDLGDQYQNAVDKARGAELPLKLFIDRAIHDGLENGWF